MKNKKLPLWAGLQDWARLFKKGEITPINHETVFRDHPIRRCQIFIVTIFPGSRKSHRR
jgi:hypothetical protein